MQRVSRSTAVSALPAPPTGGTPGYFTGGDPVAATPATVPGYEWFNNVQEELLSVIEGVGLVASGTDRTQLKQAISEMIEVKSGNYALDTGVANAYVIALNPAVAAYTNGLPVRLKFAHANTGPSTIDAGAGPVPLLNDEGAPLAAGDAPAGGIASAVYDSVAAAFLMTGLVPSQALSQAAADARYCLAEPGEIIEYAGKTLPAGYLAVPTAPTYVNATTYSALAFALQNAWGLGGTSVAAGSFVAGNTYIITALGTTDFTLIGAASNTVGIAFKATGAGAGSGTANDSVALPFVPTGYTLAQAALAVQSDGQVMSHYHSVPITSPGGSTAPSGSIFGIGAGSTGSTGGSANLAASVGITYGVKY